MGHKLRTICEADATQEIEKILAKAGKGSEDWVSQIISRSPSRPAPKPATKPAPRTKPTPKIAPAPKPKAGKVRDKAFERFIHWREKFSPQARLFDHQISMALGLIDDETERIFDKVQDVTSADPPEGCDEDDVVYMRNYSESEFRSELRNLLQKYSPAPPAPEPTAWR
jgi:hypothetical protein